MRILALMMFAAALCACAPKEPLPATAEELKVFDAEYAKAQAAIAGESAKLATEKDFRGRVPVEDFAQWVFAPKARDAIANARTAAIDAGSVSSAKLRLDEGRAVIRAEVDRARQIAGYWVYSLPAPYWRRYWNSLYETNGIEPEKPDPMLLSIESRMKTALDAGDFSGAAKIAPEIASVLPESMNLATGRILKQTGGRTQFAARATPCPTVRAPAQGDKPRLVRGADLTNFYPRGSIERNEEGAVVLRARVDAKGCAQSVAIAVHSGIPALDAAALQWFETAHFAPAAKAGRNVEADLTFKVKFELKDTAAAR
jgi:TonB family protein